MQKWEYSVGANMLDRKKNEWVVAVIGQSIYKSVSDMLKDMGNNGWELVAISTHIDSEYIQVMKSVYTSTRGEYFYFKRPISP